MSGARYHALSAAPAEVRRRMRDPLYVPGPLDDAELRDFQAFAQERGVTVRASERHPGGLVGEDDLCPHVWAWREARGQVARAPTVPGPLNPTPEESERALQTIADTRREAVQAHARLLADLARAEAFRRDRLATRFN